jgi:hypothetical protein
LLDIASSTSPSTMQYRRTKADFNPTPTRPRSQAPRTRQL